MKRNIYLNSIDLTEVETVIEDTLSKINYQPEIEEIYTSEALGRITYEEVISKISSPYYNASAMDGIAVKSAETFEASETNMVILKDYKVVNTGNAIPEEYDSVIMIEDVIEKDGNLNIIKSANAFQHIRPIGEDVVEGEMIVPRNHKIRPVDISSMLAGGIIKINVIKRPVVSIIPTGSEIITDPTKIEVGKIIDSNSHFIANTVSLLGGKPNIFSVVEDDYEVLKDTILKASYESNVLIIGAGSSAGTKDYTRSIIEELGEVNVHGISIKPGKPTIIGRINNCFVVGLPGYPVSTFISFDLVVKPLIARLLNQSNHIRQTVTAKLSKKVYSSLKHHEYVRVKLGVVKDELVCTPLNRGAGVTMSLVKADGLMVIPKNEEGFESGTKVKVELFRPLEEIRNTIVSIGSHDILMDYLDDLMSRDKFRLSSTHVGSFAGILAIKNSECHIAPIHILDDGIYNETIIDKYNLDSVLVRGVSRIQGLLVKKGNPKNIKSLDDLTGDLLFVNRQRGSGTRMLLDYKLNEIGIDKDLIDGYDYELTTHMTVASSVAEGRADAGMAVESVANLKGLDFIKVAEEHYDFLISKSVIGTEVFEKFIEVLKSSDFKKRIEDIGGYLVSDAGKVL
ncbi:molybdopterin biosynthesis protein [Mycoplasmatota bacterium WC44]